MNLAPAAFQLFRLNAGSADSGIWILRLMPGEFRFLLCHMALVAWPDVDAV